MWSETKHILLSKTKNTTKFVGAIYVIWVDYFLVYNYGIFYFSN